MTLSCYKNIYLFILSKEVITGVSVRETETKGDKDRLPH